MRSHKPRLHMTTKVGKERRRALDRVQRRSNRHLRHAAKAIARATGLAVRLDDALAHSSGLESQLCDALTALALAKADADIQRYRSSVDELTGVLNRRGFWTAVRARRWEHVLLIDLDKFKAVNDTYKHQAGDAVLVEIARRLSDAVGEEEGHGRVARMGGDEFAILTNCDPVKLASAIRTAIRKPIVIGSIEVTGVDRQVTVEMSASIGSAHIIHTSQTPEEAETAVRKAIADADAAMYRNKHGDTTPTPVDRRHYRDSATVTPLR